MAPSGIYPAMMLAEDLSEVVEHLKEPDCTMQVKGGDKVLFDLLDQRWPAVQDR